ncbi:hypothetical protein [Enterococcus timonensis]|uniref:hypothetical protein n=1 Tax=Enterococcus timonensis TaxID=1852364 RepID=UPI0008D90AF7|nr:hypothetical protein [Enterococcus timonensis]
MRYLIVRKTLLGHSYTLKKEGRVLLTAEGHHFLPILNRSLAGFIIFPHQFVFSDGKNILYQKAGVGKEKFVLKGDLGRILFWQEAIHSYHMTVNGGNFLGELLPQLTMRKMELFSGQVLVAVIEKVQDDPEVTFTVTTLTALEEPFILALAIVMDCLIHIAY